MDIEQLINTDNWFNYSKFYDWVSEQNFKTLIEVGVWKGHSVSYLADKLRNNKCEIYAVDLFEDDYSYRTDKSQFNEFKSSIDAESAIYEIYNKNLEISNTRSLIKDITGYSWEVASQFEDDYFDFIFIDADHSYESVVKDLDAWFPKIKSGGVFAGHDYGCWTGVTKAVDEFIKKHNLSLKTASGTVWYVEVK